MSDQPEASIRDFLASQREQQTDFLAELVKIHSDNPPGDCAPHAERTAALLEQIGFHVERHAVPGDLAKANGMITCTNLLVRERFDVSGPTIACNAHGDAVPPGLGWSVDPYSARIQDGHMYGRGVAVSKSDFATYAWALLALKQSQAKLRGSIELHFTYDEEAGGTIGPKWILEQGITRPDFAICAGFSYGVVTAHNGCLHLEVETIGKSGHAAEPSKAIDALEAAAGILADVYDYRKALVAHQSRIPGIGSPTLVVGLIAGGINTNVVPDNVKFRLDRRITPEEDPAKAERELSAFIKQSAERWPGTRCQVRRLLLAKPLVPRQAQDRLVDVIAKRATELFGIAIEPHGVPLYTDARHYSHAGVATVLYGAGPRTLGESRAHQADENLKLDDLYKATEVIALAFLDLLRQ